MNDNLSCEIIQDLLPNYVENKLSEESILLINTHIEKCPNCRKDYLSMKAELALNNSSNGPLNYFKKINRNFFIILITLLLITTAAIIFNTFYYAKNYDEGFFTIALLLLIIIMFTVKFIFPIVVLVLCSYKFKESKNKLLLIPVIISFIWLIYSISSLFINYFSYGF